MLRDNTQYDVNFWKTFDKTKVTTEHSTFAQFCLPYMKKGDILVDICCGNYRDTKFFTGNDLIVDAFDYEDFNLEDKVPKFGLSQMYDHAYCRFVLHAIPEHLEDYILINAHKVLNTGGLLHIEVRSDKGKKPINSHYRRLINAEYLKKKLSRLNFELMFESESADLSIYNNENPVLLRLIVRKVGSIKTRGKRQAEGCINLEDSLHILFSVKQILEANKIDFFLVFGTLLGAYRDHGFIKHDTDIDIALSMNELNHVKQLINDGYFAIYGMHCQTEHKYYRLAEVDILALGYKKDYIDFWFYTRAETRYTMGPRMSILFEQIDNGLSTIMLYGREFKTVNDIEAYLARCYPNRRHHLNTDGWKTPIENYHARR